MFSSNTIVIAPDWEPLLRANGLASAAALLDAAPAGNTGVQRIELNDGGRQRGLFIKKYGYPTARLRWSGFYRGTFLGSAKVRREFENLRRLRAWGLDAPAPVAYAEERRGRWLFRAALVSEEVEQAFPLNFFIRDWLPGLPASDARRTRRELIAKLADYTRRMHAQRFVHHDFFWRNILLNGERLDRFYLIDSHKGRRWLCRSRAARAKDLATLDAPAAPFFRYAERLRFFLRYVGHDRLTPGDKKLLRLTLRIAAPLREPQLRRVREAKPLATEAEF